MINAILQWKRHLAAVAKQNGEPILHIFWSANQLTDDYYDVLVWPDAYERRHEWWTACKHCFMTCNTISFVLWLIRKCFRRNLLDLLGDVCSLNVWFWLYLFWLLCCIMPCESSGRILCATRYKQQAGNNFTKITHLLGMQNILLRSVKNGTECTSQTLHP